MNVFDNVPMDEGTRILFSEKISIGIFVVLFQKWSWDGMEGESIIYSDKDAKKLADEELFALTRLSFLVDKGSQMTIRRCMNGYTFVNFNLDFQD